MRVDKNQQDQAFAALRRDLARIEQKMDKLLSLVDLIPNPMIRKLISSRIRS